MNFYNEDKNVAVVMVARCRARRTCSPFSMASADCCGFLEFECAALCCREGVTK